MRESFDRVQHRVRQFGAGSHIGLPALVLLAAHMSISLSAANSRWLENQVASGKYLSGQIALDEKMTVAHATFSKLRGALSKPETAAFFSSFFKTWGNRLTALS